MGIAIVAGVFTLIGVLVGAVASTGTQLFIEWQRERRSADRAKRLVCGELLQAQLILRGVYKSKVWPPIEDVNSYLPTSAWQEHRAALAAKLDEDTWNRLVLAYSVLEIDRARFVAMAQHWAADPIPERVAEGLRDAAAKLGKLRRKLGGGGGWLDELVDQTVVDMATVAPPSPVRKEPDPSGSGS